MIVGYKTGDMSFCATHPLAHGPVDPPISSSSVSVHSNEKNSDWANYVEDKMNVHNCT